MPHFPPPKKPPAIFSGSPGEWRVCRIKLLRYHPFFQALKGAFFPCIDALNSWPVSRGPHGAGTPYDKYGLDKGVINHSCGLIKALFLMGVPHIGVG